MERNEMIEMIMSKANVSKEEATQALEKSNWDVIDAILYLERKSKSENESNNSENKQVTIIEVKAKDDKEEKKESFGGLGEIMGRLFKFAGTVLKKSNSSYLEVRKDNKKPIRISLFMLGLALIFLSVPSIVLLILGLFGGYKYSITGFGENCEGVNDIFEGAAKTASNLKKDFKEGYTR